MRLAQPIETKQWSWLRGLAMHRSRPTCHFDTDCQSPVVFHGLFPSPIRLADLSLQHWELDAFVDEQRPDAECTLAPPGHSSILRRICSSLPLQSEISHPRRQQPLQHVSDHQRLVLSRTPRQCVGPLEPVRPQDLHFPIVGFARAADRHPPVSRPVAQGGRVRPAPELQLRRPDHLCCAVRGR